MNNKTKAVRYVFALAVIVWCSAISVGLGNFTSKLMDINEEQKALTRNLAYIMDRLQVLENIEPEVIVKEVIKEVEVIKEIIKEVPVEVDIKTGGDDE
jgi:hypothetical protein